jgi:hypothetical protein
VVIGRTSTFVCSTPRARAMSWIAAAKSYHEATPASVKWCTPAISSSARRSSARARLAAWVGVPTWSATTEMLSRVDIRRSIVSTKFLPPAA